MNRFLRLSILTVWALIGSSMATASFCDWLLGAKNFSEGFPKTVVKEGTLMERMTAFAEAHPDRVKAIDDVLLRFEDGMTHSQGQKARRVFVISTNGMTLDEAAPFIKSYLDAVAWKTISHPLSQSAGHLYTRVGTKTLDFMGEKLRMNAYPLPSSPRLETFVSLSDTEFENMRTYIQNARDSKNVLGKFSYQGGNQTQGTLKHNQITDDQGHNCTSWLGLAPIGENGQAMKDAIGVRWDVHRNPGWWTAYLQTKLPEDRVPFVVYMDSSPMNVILERVKSGEVLRWDYNLH